MLYPFSTRGTATRLAYTAVFAATLVVVYLHYDRTMEHKLSETTQNQTSTPEPLSFIEETIPTVHFDFKFDDNKVSFDRKPQNRTQQIKPTSSARRVLPPSISQPEVPDGAEKRYLVYICDNHGLCGGIGDRQRTITSFFLLARLSNRQFYMIMSSPCNFNHFYIPRNYQWQPNMTELEPPSDKNTLYFMTFCKEGDEFMKQLSEGDFNTKYPQRVIYFRTNYDISEPLCANPFYSKLMEQWNGLQDKRDRFHWAWHELMQPSPKLMTNLERVLGSRFLGRKGLMSPFQVKTLEIKSLYDVGDSKLICAHVRMGGNPSIPMDGHYVRVRLSEIPTIHKFMLSKDTDGNAMFFVATDYINIRIRAHNKFGRRFIDYGAKIFHTDRQRSGNDICEGFGDAALDQLILSLCDVLVVCHSGFGVGAYYISNSTGHGYYVENEDVFLFEGKRSNG